MTGAMRALAVLALVLLGGCIEADYRWRERLTLVFDTPHGEVAVSGVTEAYVGFYSYPVIGSGNELSGWRNGEAMPIDLGDGGKVYALLKSFGFAAAIYEDLCYLRTCGPLFTAPNPPEPACCCPPRGSAASSCRGWSG